MGTYHQHTSHFQWNQSWDVTADMTLCYFSFFIYISWYTGTVAMYLYR